VHRSVVQVDASQGRRGRYRVVCRPRRTQRGAAWAAEICAGFLAQGTSYPLAEIVEAYRYVETEQKIGNVVITVEVGDRPLPMITILLINCRCRSWLKQRSAAEVHGRYGRSLESDWTDERSPALLTPQLRTRPGVR